MKVVKQILRIGVRYYNGDSDLNFPIVEGYYESTKCEEDCTDWFVLSCQQDFFRFYSKEAAFKYVKFPLEEVL